MTKPAGLLKDHWHLLINLNIRAPVLDLACGDGRNGIFLAGKGFEVSCWDVSEKALERAGWLARASEVKVKIRQVDLEQDGVAPLTQNHYGAILVFRYLHRPLIPSIKNALKDKGLLFYETFTMAQSRYGKPHNPDHLLKPGELLGWFGRWHVFHYFEGLKQDPTRAMAQIICQKP